jgi:4-diphosphocytidyl-2-C-methyl-D-erythritol kinase
MDRIALAAPAKINLGLRIRGRRPDGFHLLESLFLPIDLADAVEVAEAPAFALAIEGDAPGVPAGAGNLAARAVAAFCRAAGIPDAFAVRLRKRVPAAAGLGGGSSDAAAVLRALARLRPGAVGDAELGALALSLGADVPFFLDPRPALVEGIGERILPVRDLPSLPLLLAHPGVPLATADVFHAYDEAADSLTPEGAAPTIRRLLKLPAAGGTDPTRAGTPELPGVLRELIVNDLEPAAVRLCPAIGGLREEIQATGALAVGMSGSGPTVFGVYADETGARRAARKLRTSEARTSPDAQGGPGRSAVRDRRMRWVVRTMSSADGPDLGWGVAKW